MAKFRDLLYEDLKDDECALAFLSVAFESYQEDGHTEMFLTVLRDIAKAQGGLSKLARNAKLNRSNLYEQLSKNGNPSFKTVDKVLHELGFHLVIQPYKRKPTDLQQQNSINANL